MLCCAVILSAAQDRWFELSGAEGVQVRVRLAVVPGTLPAAAAAAAATKSSSRRPKTPGRSAAAAAAAGRGDDVLEMLGFFQERLQSSSRDSILVEVGDSISLLPTPLHIFYVHFPFSVSSILYIPHVVRLPLPCAPEGLFLLRSVCMCF